MSFEAWCWSAKQPVGKPSERALLSVLANFADRNGLCWPSVKTLAEACGMSRRGVSLVLQGLVERGLVSIEGKTSARRYRLAMASRETQAKTAQAESDACADSAPACATVSPSSRNGCAQTSQEPIINQSGVADAPPDEARQARRDDKRGTRLSED